jgi:NADPH:quinone reductase-like Zn-dependent oxidoreductase
MKAFIIKDYGNRDQLQLVQMSKPKIQDDEVLVKIIATSVNPVDWKAREGMLRKHRDFDLPLILGWDLSGIVTEVGKIVTKFQVGEAVYGMPDLTKNGTYAEFIAVKEDYLALKPESLSHIEAASIPLVGLTAWQSLIIFAKPKKGDRVLIHAGAGGVGSFAIQLAKYLGAYVVTTASKRNKEFLYQLGADQVIDYQKYDFSKELSNLDIVFDTVGGTTLERSYQVLKPGGKLISIAGSPNHELAEKYSIHVHHVEVQPDGKQLKEIANLLDSNHIKPVVTQVFELEDIKKAHELSESRHVRGKISVIIK